MLAALSVKISLCDYIHFSQAERSPGGCENENILADVFEALIGALYLDAGLEACRTLITELWEEVIHTMKTPPQHPKTALQEWAQGAALPLPEYTIVGQSGPDHAPLFDVELKVKGHPDIVAQGRTRQEAEKEAARTFLEKVQDAP